MFLIAGDFFPCSRVGMCFLCQNMECRNKFMAVLYFKELEIYPSFFDIFKGGTVILFSDTIRIPKLAFGTEMPTIRALFFM